jgi:hypothetical protein
MQTENDIDQLFRRKLEDPEIPFNEMDWEDMQRKLDGQHKKRVLPLWLMAASGIAAALTIFLYWIFLRPVQEPGKIAQLPVQHKLRDTEKPGFPLAEQMQHVDNGYNKSTEVPAEHNLNFQSPDSYVAKHRRADGAEGLSGSILAPKPVTLLPVSASQSLSSVLPFISRMQTSGLNSPITIRQALRAQTAAELLEQKASALANSKDPFEKISTAEIAGSVQRHMDKNLDQRPTLILSAMAAPDITSAASRKPAKLSSNFGMLGTFALGSHFSVTSGAIYAKKYYNSGGTAPDGTYATGSNLAWEVKAICNVLDIPLNVNYKVLSRQKLSVSVNSGLSSYIMLKEKYEYITEQPGNVKDVSTLELSNQNKHLFGVANVSVSVDHQLSDNLSIGVQPFMKLPLTGIGNGNVNLKSTGVSLSLNIGLFPAKKGGKFATNRYSALH